jgi:hypothetical protein
MRAFLSGTKFDDRGLFLGTNAGVVDRSRHVIPCPSDDTQTDYIAASFDIFELEIPSSIDVSRLE